MGGISRSRRSGAGPLSSGPSRHAGRSHLQIEAGLTDSRRSGSTSTAWEKADSRAAHKANVGASTEPRDAVGPSGARAAATTVSTATRVFPQPVDASATPGSRIKSPTISTLSGFRLLAAAWIFAYHWRQTLARSIDLLPWHAGGQLLVRFFGAGYVAVSALFVLSGFVLAYQYPAPMKGPEWVRFWVARIARIYPGHCLAFAICAPLFLARWFRHLPTVSWAEVGIYLSLSSAWMPTRVFSVQDPGWSTSAVAFFYAAFPFLITLLSLRSPRGLLHVALGIWAAGLIAPAVVAVLRLPDVDSASESAYWALVVRYNPALRLAEFASGVAVGLWWRRSRATLPGWCSCAALLAWPALSLAPVPRTVLHNGLLTPVLATALVGLAGGQGLLPRILAWPPFAFLGQAGFGIFILQVPVGHVVTLGMKLLGQGEDPTAFSFVITATLTIAAAVASLHFLERPAQKAIVAAHDRFCSA